MTTIRNRDLVRKADPGDLLSWDLWHDDHQEYDDAWPIVEEHREAIRCQLRDRELAVDEDAATAEGLPVVPLHYCERCWEPVTSVDGDGVCRACAESRETVPPAVFEPVPVRRTVWRAA